MEIAQRWKKNMKPIEKPMLYNLSLIQNPTLREKVDRFIVKKMISAKLKLGLGNSKKLIGSNDVINIEEQLADELHKPIITKFYGRKIYSKEVDLTGLLTSLNSIMRRGYALTVIDLRSRYAWVVPLKNKTGNTLMLAFQQIFTNSKRKP